MKKKFIDENGRLFGLVSLIDVAVIAIAAVLVFALTTKETASPIISIAAPMDKISYELTISNMPEGRLNSLKAGESIYDSDNGNPLGTIADIKVEDCVISILKADGTFDYAPVEGRYNVIMTIQADAITDERQHTYVNRASLVALGWSLNIHTQASTFSGLITALTK